MRRETLKTTEREHTTKSETPVETTVRTGTTPTMTEHRDMFTMMRDIERMMENTFGRVMDNPFRRPLMGLDWPIFRHLLPEGGLMGELAPVVDVYEEGNELVVKAELPGIKKENVKVNLVENTLTISGERAEEDTVERKDYLRLERTHGAFSRSLTLPEGLDDEKVHAAFTDGVLEIRIPRHEEHRTMRTINVE
jgi:HSP20 family protein